MPEVHDPTPPPHPPTHKAHSAALDGTSSERLEAARVREPGSSDHVLAMQAPREEEQQALAPMALQTSSDSNRIGGPSLPD